MPSLLLGKNSANNLSFAGVNTAKVNFPSIIEDISKKDLNNIQVSLTKKISTFAPEFSFKDGSNFYYKKSNPLIETLTYPFLKLPREILNGVANNIEFIESNFRMKSLFDLTELYGLRRICFDMARL